MVDDARPIAICLVHVSILHRYGDGASKTMESRPLLLRSRDVIGPATIRLALGDLLWWSIVTMRLSCTVITG